MIMSWRFVHLRHASARVRGLKPVVRSLTMSSVEGSIQPPLSNSTLIDYFTREIVEKHGSRPALVCQNEMPRAHGGPLSRNLGTGTHLAWDFEEFDRHIRAVACGLLTLGVKKGDRVGVMMGNNRYNYSLSSGPPRCDNCYSAYASLQWACASIGRFNLINTMSLFNSMLTRRDIGHNKSCISIK
jgi:acyl-CoA synthetase (AMP-forming)/AMP-acid ligase II